MGSSISGASASIADRSLFVPYCQSYRWPLAHEGNVIAVLLSGTSTSGEDDHDEYDVDDDVHQLAVGVHPVTHFRHELLRACGTADKTAVEAPLPGLLPYKRQRREKPGVVLREVRADRQLDDEVGGHQQDHKQPGC